MLLHLILSISLTVILNCSSSLVNGLVHRARGTQRNNPHRQLCLPDFVDVVVIVDLIGANVEIPITMCISEKVRHTYIANNNVLHEC